MPNTRRPKTQQVAELWDRYAQGDSVAQVARRFGKQQSPLYDRIQAWVGSGPRSRRDRHGI